MRTREKSFNPLWNGRKGWRNVQKSRLGRPGNIDFPNFPPESLIVVSIAEHGHCRGCSDKRRRPRRAARRSPARDRRRRPRLVVLSDGLWRRRFGGDRNLVGKAILLEGEPYVVTGVLGARFTADPAADIWLPLDADPNTVSHSHTFRVAGRLKPGITLEMAKAQMKLAEDQFQLKFPGHVHGRASAGCCGC